MSLLNTGLTALSTAQLGMRTAQHNIANANTPGYSRQAILQATNAAMFTGSGYVGQGVHVETIRRSYSDVLTRQVNMAQSKSSELDTHYAMISRIDSLLADSNSGISPVLAGFFQGVQDVAANPGLVSARQSMVSSAQVLANRFQILDDRLVQLAAETNTQIHSSVELVNTYSARIADLNIQISMLASTGQPPNDLQDERDQLVLELNKLIRVSTVIDSDGNMNVFAGMGQQVVVGSSAIPLEARPSEANPEQWVIAQKNGMELPTSYFDGGSIGGLLAFRNEALTQTNNTLGQLAASIALTVNAQHALGQDLLGNSKSDADFVADFFRISAPKSTANARNTGMGSVADFHFLPSTLSPEGNYYTQLTGSNYAVQFDTGGSFTVTRLADNALVASGSEGTAEEFDGLSLNFAAGHAKGDRYLLQPTCEVGRNLTVNQEIVGDVRKIAAASPVRTETGENIGAATISAGEIVDANYVRPASPIILEYDEGPPGELQLASGSGSPTSVLVNGTAVTYPFSFSYNSGDEITIDGFRFTITGTPADGDTFRIAANTGGLADSRNIVRIGALQTQETMNGDSTKGLATFQVAYAQLVSDIGSRTKSVAVNGDAQRVVLEQSIAARDSVAGVNLDEEWANIMQYQLSYQAAARMMDTVSKMFDVIINIGR
ncbi:MAG: flagellar hook-associated protein FlgK [Zoogloeaceae bacterium]|jgi:flagellar hook-associated protein 1 FlgK|nr:flagellar hook-associated protein FlgK [Zoogloeaceae bacterium]